MRYSRGMAREIAQRELRNDNAKVMAAVAAGNSFVVTRNGEPVAELRPLHRERRTFVPREEIEALAVRASRIDRAAFRDDTDRAVDQGLER